MKQEAQFSRSASRKVLAATRAALAIVLLTVMASAWQARAQNFIVLHTFANTPDGAYPVAPVLRDAAGTLYGTTFFGGTESAGTVFKVDKDDTETVLFSFSGTEGRPSGAFPSGIWSPMRTEIFTAQLWRAAAVPAWFTNSPPVEKKPSCTISKVESARRTQKSRNQVCSWIKSATSMAQRYAAALPKAATPEPCSSSLRTES